MCPVSVHRTTWCGCDRIYCPLLLPRGCSASPALWSEAQLPRDCVCLAGSRASLGQCRGPGSQAPRVSAVWTAQLSGSVLCGRLSSPGGRRVDGPLPGSGCVDGPLPRLVLCERPAPRVRLWTARSPGQAVWTARSPGQCCVDGPLPRRVAGFPGGCRSSVLAVTQERCLSAI